MIINFFFRMVKFRDSHYSVEAEIEMLEGKGLHGGAVLYEGIKTGSCKVSVSLMSAQSAGAAKVPAAEITVIVTENLYLLPPTAYVMVGAIVDYHAEQIKANQVSTKYY